MQTHPDNNSLQLKIGKELKSNSSYGTHERQDSSERQVQTVAHQQLFALQPGTHTHQLMWNRGSPWSDTPHQPVHTAHTQNEKCLERIIMLYKVYSATYIVQHACRKQTFFKSKSLLHE